MKSEKFTTFSDFIENDNNNCIINTCRSNIKPNTTEKEEYLKQPKMLHLITKIKEIEEQAQLSYADKKWKN